MRFFFLIIIDSDEKHAAFVMLQAVKVLLLPNLVQGAFGAVIPLQFNDHGRVAPIQRNEYDVRESLSGGHFLYYGVAVKGIDEGQIDRTLQGILVVVAAVGGDVDVTDIQCLCDSLRIAGSRLFQKPSGGLDDLVCYGVLTRFFQGTESFLPNFLVGNVTGAGLLFISQISQMHQVAKDIILT